MCFGIPLFSLPFIVSSIQPMDALILESTYVIKGNSGKHTKTTLFNVFIKECPQHLINTKFKRN